MTGPQQAAAMWTGKADRSTMSLAQVTERATATNALHGDCIPNQHDAIPGHVLDWRERLD